MESFQTEGINRSDFQERKPHERTQYNNRIQKKYNTGNNKYNSHNRSNKYCNFHNSSSHNDSECRAQRKPRNKGENGNKGKTYALRELMKVPKTIEIPISINKYRHTALLDTGSVENYISDKLASKFNIKTIELNTEKQAEMANGSLIKIKQFTNLSFKIDNYNNNVYKSMFHIIPNKNETIILGMHFICENDAIINIRKNTLNLNGVGYEILKDNEPLIRWKEK
ncbi:hypothetical protein DMUE_4164 [Dictyocoela muelleri]|nr:hypothetical protein DMUE_4164 [Dictyocoela muelleri]